MTEHLDILKTAIHDRYWTQRETAMRAGISPQHLSDILAGKRRISARMAVRFEFLLHVEAWRLLSGQAHDDLLTAYADNTDASITAACQTGVEGQSVR